MTPIQKLALKLSKIKRFQIPEAPSESQDTFFRNPENGLLWERIASGDWILALNDPATAGVLASWLPPNCTIAGSPKPWIGYGQMYINFPSYGNSRDVEFGNSLGEVAAKALLRIHQISQ